MAGKQKCGLKEKKEEKGRFCLKDKFLGHHHFDSAILM